MYGKASAWVLECWPFNAAKLWSWTIAATLLCLLPLSLRPLMFYVSLLVVSLSLVGMWFLVFLLFFFMVLALRVVQFLLVLFQVVDIHDKEGESSFCYFFWPWSLFCYLYSLSFDGKYSRFSGYLYPIIFLKSFSLKNVNIIF